MLDAEIHYYFFSQNSLSRGWWGSRKSSPHAHFFSLPLLLIGRHASPVTACKTGHAHFLSSESFPFEDASSQSKYLLVTVMAFI